MGHAFRGMYVNGHAFRGMYVNGTCDIAVMREVYIHVLQLQRDHSCDYIGCFTHTAA